MLVSLIAAVARQGVIGHENRLPWNLPAELGRFRELTWGKPIVMGRRTHESIGRRLPGRRNIIVTRHGRVLGDCERADSLERALAMAVEAGATETMVIGGRRCFREALPLAGRFYLTRIERRFAGDVRFPTDVWFSGDRWLPEGDHRGWVVRDREWVPPGRDVDGSPGYELLTLERPGTERTSPV